MSRLFVRGLILALGAVLLLATTACGGSSTPSDQTGPAEWEQSQWDNATWEP